MAEKSLLTGIRDLDREIVNKLSDKDLLQMCLLNKTYSERVCDDNYFRIRTENRFPETVPYKDYVNENEVKDRKDRKDRKGRTRRVRTWKNHYLNVVKYIDLLQRIYRYIYTAKDKSPELLYLARRLIHNYIYSKNDALISASECGNLEVVKYLVEMRADITAKNNEAVRFAIENAHLPVLKYLVEHGADMNVQDNCALRWASYYGHLSVVKYLVENGAHARDNEAVKIANKRKHLDIVKYLRSLQ